MFYAFLRKSHLEPEAAEPKGKEHKFSDNIFTDVNSFMLAKLSCSHLSVAFYTPSFRYR